MEATAEPRSLGGMIAFLAVRSWTFKAMFSKLGFQDGIDWKQRFYGLVDKIEEMEERMTRVVYKTKSDALESEFWIRFLSNLVLDGVASCRQAQRPKLERKTCCSSGGWTISLLLSRAMCPPSRAFGVCFAGV